MLYLITIYSLLFAYLAYRHLHWAIYLIVAALPSYLIRFTFFGIPMTLLEIMILILFAVFILKNRLNWLKEFKNNPFFWPIIFILIFAASAMFISPNFKGAAGVWKAYFIEPALFFIVLISAIKTKKELENLFWALGLSALYLGLFAVWQKFSGWGVPQAFLKADGSVDRVVSVFGYPNALGLYLGPIIILYTGFLWQKTKNIFLLLLKISVIILSVLIIVLAKSEATMLSVIIVWLLWGLIYSKTRVATVVIIIILAVVFFTNPLINYYLTVKISLQDYSGLVRRLIWQESSQMLKNNWLLGAGLAGYQTKIAPYHLPTFEIYLYPHNIVLNFWSELGLLGLLSFIWLMMVFLWQNLKKIIKQKKDAILNITLIAIVLQMIIHGLVDVPYFKNDLSVLFWIIIAIFIIQQKLSKNGGMAELVESAALEKR